MIRSPFERNSVEQPQSKRTHCALSRARWLLLAALSVGITLTAAPASSAPRRAPSSKRSAAHTCVTAYNDALSRAQAGRLRESRELWAACARPACGSFLAHECGTMYTQLEGDIPTLVLLATDGAGVPHTNVKVAIDGEVVAAQLDGRGLPVDPGVHEISLTSDIGSYSTKVLVGQGQRNRPIAVVLRNEEAPAPPAMLPDPARSEERGPEPASPPVTPLVDLTAQPEPPARRGHALAYVLGGTGLAGVGGFALLTYWGRKDNAALGVCDPHCSQNDVDHVHRVYLGANVALGVGVAALAGAYWAYTTRDAKHESESEREAYRFDLTPTRSGTLATVSGSF